MLGELLHAVDDAVELRGPKLLLSCDARDVAPQLLEAVAADGNAEVLARDVLDFMRFVEDNGMIIGQNTGQIVLFYGQICEKKVMVDDDNVAFHGALVHQGDKTAVKLRAFLACAEVAASVD